MGHVMMENRHGLAVDTRLTLATGTAEREAALAMAKARPGNRRITVGADKAYDAAGFVAALRERNATPHIAQNTSTRRSTAAPPAIPVTRSAAAGANALRRSSDGPRRRLDCARPVIAGWRASVGSSRLPPPPTIWCVCPSYWARRHSHARIALQCRVRGQNPVREPFQYRNLYNHSVFTLRTLKSASVFCVFPHPANKRQITRAIYEAKIDRWRSIWSGLTVLQWDDAVPGM